MKIEKYILVLSLIFIWEYSKCEEVKMVIEVIRHGARSPIFDIMGLEWKKRGYGSMEILEPGKRQHYLGGLNMRKSYKEIFENLKEDEYYVRSTGTERTIESAFAKLLGIFEGNKTKISDVIYHSKEVDRDPVMLFGNYAPCVDYYKTNIHRTNIIRGKLFRSEKLKKFSEEFSKELNFGRNLTLFELAMIGDEVISDSFYSKNPKIDPNSETFKKLKIINSANHLAKYYNKEFLRVMSTPFLIELKNQIFKKYHYLTNQTKEEHKIKYFLYSTHDTFFTPFYSLGLINRYCVMEQAFHLKDDDCLGKISVSTSLIFELVEETKTKHYVRTKLNGEYINFCNQRFFEIEDKENFKCNLRKFYERFQDLVELDWREKCMGVLDYDKYVRFLPVKIFYKILIPVLGSICFFCVLFWFLVLKKYYTSRRFYEALKSGDIRIENSESDENDDKVKED